MAWWRPFTSWRSDDEIATYVIAEVEAGRIKPELASMVERALRDEAAGKCIVMRNPGIKPRPPRAPGLAGVSTALGGIAKRARYIELSVKCCLGNRRLHLQTLDYSALFSRNCPISISTTVRGRSDWKAVCEAAVASHGD